MLWGGGKEGLALGGLGRDVSAVGAGAVAGDVRGKGRIGFLGGEFAAGGDEAGEDEGEEEAAEQGVDEDQPAVFFSSEAEDVGGEELEEGRQVACNMVSPCRVFEIASAYLWLRCRGTRPRPAGRHRILSLSRRLS